MSVGAPASTATAPAATLIAPTDGELLMRHRTRGDEAALAELQARHAPMVWAVCREVLRREQDAEDAFQATLLILVERGHAIRASDSAAGWLYRVALRAAMAKKRAAARRREEPIADDPPAPEVAFPDIQRRRMTAVLMEELRGLPDKYQTPLVLRYLEGQSRRAIAAQTDTTVAGVQGRLARGKRMLRSRLARRGVSLSLAMGALAGGARSSAATVYATAPSPGALASASPAVQSLVHEGVRSMIMSAYVKPVVATLAVALATTLAAVANEAPAPQGASDAKPAFELMSEVDDDALVAEQEATTPVSQPATDLPSPGSPRPAPRPPRAPEERPRLQFGGVVPASSDAALLPDVKSPTSKRLELERDHWNLKAEALREKAEAMEVQQHALSESDDARRMKLIRNAEARAARAEAMLMRADAKLAEAKALELSLRLEQPTAPHPTRNRPTQPQPPTPLYRNQMPTAAPTPIVEPRKADTLSAGDTIQIRAMGIAPQHPIDGHFTIEPGGTVALGPMYGRVKVAGKSVIDAEGAIKETLSEMFQDPRVQVTRPAPARVQERPAPPISDAMNSAMEDATKRVQELMDQKDELQESLARSERERDEARAMAEQQAEEALRAMRRAQAEAEQQRERAQAAQRDAEAAQAAEHHQRQIAEAHVHQAKTQNDQLRAELNQLQAQIQQLEAQRSSAERETGRGELTPGEQIAVEAIAMVRSDGGALDNRHVLRSTYIIEPMGTIPLGALLGRVEIAGNEIREAEAVIEKHLRDRHVGGEDVAEYRVQITRRSGR